MNYLLPAWHDQLIDWAYSIPQIEIYDGLNYAQVLKDKGMKIALVLTDYQPQMTAKLLKSKVGFDKIYSVFDDLQDTQGLMDQGLDFRDFSWPADASFDFGLFRLSVISKGKLFANVIFNTEGKLLDIEYYTQNGQLKSKLHIDSRGFVSSEEDAKEKIFYDRLGRWRFKINKKTGQVMINDQFNRFHYLVYANINELIQEAFTNHFLKRVKSQDRLIVTLDDHATIGNHFYRHFKPIYMINPRCPYQKSLVHLTAGQVLAPSRQIEKSVREKLADRLPVTFMPSFSTRVNLGHSQRLKRQIIALFAEYCSRQELDQLLAQFYERLIKDPDGEGLYVLTYSFQKDNMVIQAFEKLEKQHVGAFLTEEQAKQRAENDLQQLTKAEDKPVLYLRHQRLASVADTYKVLDQARLLVNWRKSNDFIQFSAISAGIPQLQNFPSSTLVDHKNGRIFHNGRELKEGLDFYLGNLKNWNQALVYDVQLLNRYSEDYLIKRWRQILV